MKGMKPSITRRRFLSGFGALPVTGALAGTLGSRRALSSPSEAAVYEALGVRPFINAAGTYTRLSGSLMPREVVAAMEEASRQHVSIPELQEAVSRRIAALVGAEAALVTTGCAAALTVATAACVTGIDEDAIRRVPETAGLKNQVIFQKSHRFDYDHAIRNVGVEIVEVETKQELLQAVNHRTAMLFFLNLANADGRIEREEFAALGKETGIPTLIDAAADLPPAGNLTAFTKMGYDLVAFSGGKGLRGPQCSGLLLGRKHLIDAAFLNGPPHSDSIGRIAKVGKEEIVGLAKAVDLYVAKDHEAEWKEWERRVGDILSAVQDIEGVRAERFVPPIANEVPHAAIEWDRERIDMTRDEFAGALRDGEPRIEPRPSPGDAPRLEIGVWMMAPGEHRIVADRCAEILRERSG